MFLCICAANRRFCGLLSRHRAADEEGLTTLPMCFTIVDATHGVETETRDVIISSAFYSDLFRNFADLPFSYFIGGRDESLKYVQDMKMVKIAGKDFFAIAGR